jgi:SulP family sulfate permease
LISRLIPASEWLRSYGRRELYGDFSSALVITVMLVPQSMAYALLAGLPPIYGLYASTVPTIVYALFGSSRHMPVGPPALMALLTFTSVSALAEPGTGRYIGFALLLAAMVGVIQLSLGLARLGFITNFISHPVLSGFIYASAIVIAISQAEGLLGVSLPEGVSTLRSLAALVGVVDQTNLLTLALGLTSLLLILILERASTRLPGSLFVVVSATVVVYGLGLGLYYQPHL